MTTMWIISWCRRHLILIMNWKENNCIAIDYKIWWAILIISLELINWPLNFQTNMNQCLRTSRLRFPNRIWSLRSWCSFMTRLKATRVQFEDIGTTRFGSICWWTIKWAKVIICVIFVTREWIAPMHLKSTRGYFMWQQ